MNAKLRLGTIKTLGGIGYIAIVFQWLQVVIAWLPGFIDSGLGKIIFPQPHATPKTIAIPAAGGPAASPDFVTTFLITALALALAGLAAYVVIVRYTKAIRKTGSQITHIVAQKATHIIVHKPLKQVSARKRTLLNRRVLFWTKLAFGILPLALLPAVLHGGSHGIIEQLALFVQAVFATIAVVSFSVQAALAARWHERVDDVE